MWELTLACNLRCKHCGSGAGQSRVDELGTNKCLDVVEQLADLGCELITLSGGEPTLRDDWDVIGRAIADKGVLVNMVTNGVYRNGHTAEEIGCRAQDAGLCNVGVSIDGAEEAHDFNRGARTFEQTVESIRRFSSMGLKVAVLTTINRLNLDQLEQVRRIAIDSGATQWRLQRHGFRGGFGGFDRRRGGADRLLGVRYRAPHPSTYPIGRKIRADHRPRGLPSLAMLDEPKLV